MSKYTKLYVDDIRNIPGEDWDLARNAWEALYKLQNHKYDVVSLDHDLDSFIGDKEITGYDITLWLVYRKQQWLYTPTTILVHSANPVGSKYMNNLIEKYLK